MGFEEVVLGTTAQSENAVAVEYLSIADPKPENPLISTAWTVLEAANDDGDRSLSARHKRKSERGSSEAFRPQHHLRFLQLNKDDPHRPTVISDMEQVEVMSIPDSRSFLQELDDAIAKGSAESRLRALWHATDLLIAGRYSDSEIWIFGEVIGRLAEEIEVVARAQLAKRLAHTDNAPKSIVRKLGFDDSIDVAGPVLQHSERLDADVLVANIRFKSQDHLLAISKRKTLAHSVTD
jgi:Uncharacterised protein conserved in bacteria (DUF2336)